MDKTPDQIEEIVISILKEMGKSYNNKTLKNADQNTKIYTADGNGLDSLMFVRFISELERRLSEAWGKEVVLTNDDLIDPENIAFKSVDNLVNLLSSHFSDS